MIYIKLFLSFVKIGLFSFGGGYAMIPLIQREIEMHGWLSSSEFIDIIAISQMTPGPIAVNSATFVGYKIAGIFGGAAATAGVVAPSLVIILIVSQFFFKYNKHTLNITIFYGIRPVIVGLIFTAGIFVSKTALFKEDISIKSFASCAGNVQELFNFGGCIIFALSLVLLIKFKIHPFLAILSSGIAGVIVFSFLPL